MDLYEIYGEIIKEYTLSESRLKRVIENVLIALGQRYDQEGADG